MEFKEFAKLINTQFLKMAKGQLFKVAISKADVWNNYLDAYPPGTNELYKENREYDCHCCKQFIKNIGNIVSIVNGKIVTIWDINGADEFKIVADRMSEFLRQYKISTLFLSKESGYGAENSMQLLDGSPAINWNHFYIDLPSSCINERDYLSKPGKAKTNSRVFKRGLEEITPESLKIVLDLINQNAIYRGDEFKQAVKQFKALSTKYHKLTPKQKHIFIWDNINVPCGLIRNTAIGTLLQDISEGVGLTKAVGSFESKVAPINYKRTTALVTPRMIDDALATLDELNLTTALERRFAVASDISINNVIFADRATSTLMKDSLKTNLMKEAKSSNKDFANVVEIGIEEFIENVIPNITSIKAFVENTHMDNMVSLVGPKHTDAEKLFPWDNDFSWSYVGNVTDSIKERVKRAGGAVDGAVRASLAWFNSDDLDIHMHLPNNDTICFNRKQNSKTRGNLDVDMNIDIGSTNSSVDPVENITFPSLNKLIIGDYTIAVNQFTARNSSNVGFDLQIAFEGYEKTFNYPKKLKQKETVQCATIHWDGYKCSVTINPRLTEESGSKEIWNIHTNKDFHKVSLMCYSPNHWDSNKNGNKHYMFILDNCINPDETRGIYNEFLRSDLTKHRKVLEIVGEKTKCPTSNEQLSGLGFSSTKRASLIVKVKGSFNRTLKINF